MFLRMLYERNGHASMLKVILHDFTCNIIHHFERDKRHGFRFLPLIKTVLKFFFSLFQKQGSSTLSLHFSYRQLNSNACIYRLNLAAKKNKNTERRAGLRFDRIHEKLNYPKRFTENIEKKIKDDLFFIKTIHLGPRRSHGIFHENLSSICRVYFTPH